MPIYELDRLDHGRFLHGNATVQQRPVFGADRASVPDDLEHLAAARYPFSLAPSTDCRLRTSAPGTPCGLNYRPSLAVLHQLVGACLVAATVWGVHALGRTPDRSGR